MLLSYVIFYIIYLYSGIFPAYRPLNTPPFTPHSPPPLSPYLPPTSTPPLTFTLYSVESTGTQWAEFTRHHREICDWLTNCEAEVIVLCVGGATVASVKSESQLFERKQVRIPFLFYTFICFYLPIILCYSIWYAVHAIYIFYMFKGDFTQMYYF